MACKSCKKNKSSGMIKNIIDLKNGIKNKVHNPTNVTPDKSHELYNYEKIILTVLGWIPLGIGYYHIVKFIISLF